MTGVTLTVGGERLTGWTSARVARALETVAGTFRVRLSERAPGTGRRRPVVQGTACAVEIDGEPVLAGYVDEVRIGYDTRSHELEVTGRDATGQLVDCSASSKPGEWKDETLRNIAAAIAAPFGVAVSGDAGGPFAKFRIEEGETAFEAIERACRMRGVLPRADGDGGLVVAPLEPTRATVTLRRADALSADGRTSWLDRYSEYLVKGQQAGGDTIRGEAAAHVTGEATDPGVTRYRPMTFIAEQGVSLQEARERAEWEATVRAARSRVVRYVVQGWREQGAEGPVWRPGTLVRVVDDWLGVDRDLMVSGVDQTYDEGGTVSTLVLTPEDSWLPGPVRKPKKAEPTGFWG